MTKVPAKGKSTTTVHVLVGEPRSLGDIPVRTSILSLPKGNSTTRWLSHGASSAQGWGAALERELNDGSSPSRHAVVDLCSPELDAGALTDELDPRWDKGLPHAAATAERTLLELFRLGAKTAKGWLLVDLLAPCPASRIRKIRGFAVANFWKLSVRAPIVEGAVPEDVLLVDVSIGLAEWATLLAPV